MDYIAARALKAARALEGSLAVFSVIELTYFFIALIIALYVLRKYSSVELGNALSPLRFAVFASVMLGTTGFLALYWGIAHALLALAFGVGATLSFADPMAAVGFYVVNMILRPWDLSDESKMSFVPKVFGLLCLISWLFHYARARKFTLLISWPTRLFFMLFAWFCLSAVVGGALNEDPGAWVSKMLILPVGFLLVSNVPDDERDLRFLLRLLVVSITGLMLHSILVTRYVGGIRLENYGQFGNSNDLASFIAFALPLAFLPAVRAGMDRGTRLIAIVGIPILLLALVMSQSRAAMMSVALSAVVLWNIRARRKFRTRLLTALMIPALAGAVSLLSLARDSAEKDESAESRKTFMLAGLHMGLRNPFVGVGWGNYPKLWQNYAVTKILEPGLRAAHNTWVHGFAEGGFPELFLLLFFYGICLQRAYSVQSQYPEILLSLIAYGVSITFLTHTYMLSPYLFCAIALSAARIIRP